MSKAKSKIILIASCIILLLSILATAGMINLLDYDSISKQVLGAAIGKPKPKIGTCIPNTIEEVTISKVLDGDTVAVTGGCTDRVRFLYVDTPETVKPNTPVQCFGPESSNFAKSKLEEGLKVYLKSDKELNDKYGRSLRILYYEKNEVDNIEKSYNYELVSKGYGLAKFYSPNRLYQKEILSGQEIARTKNLGIWKACK